MYNVNTDKTERLPGSSTSIPVVNMDADNVSLVLGIISRSQDVFNSAFIINLYYPLSVVFTFINFGIFFTISFSGFFIWSRLLLNLCCGALHLILPRFLPFFSTVELSRNDGSLFTNESHAPNSNNVMIMSSSSSSGDKRNADIVSDGSQLYRYIKWSNVEA